ncbi:hypothetical protein F2Q68_00006033 [Brassica cretica]|uniref:Uncharacterized protein n=1 Tax=Brassica cretica TaxID=69181 RepID=A0A8S9JB89_BRACR|nr:hypothetical protein F2Q68_00006033 [Brassica cretica]
MRDVLSASASAMSGEFSKSTTTSGSVACPSDLSLLKSGLTKKDFHFFGENEPDQTSLLQLKVSSEMDGVITCDPIEAEK